MRKINLQRLRYLLAFLLLNSTVIFAQTKKQVRFFPAPFVFYTPETRWGGGVGATYFFTSKEKLHPNDTITRLSNLNVSSLVTQNKQFLADIIWNAFTYQNKYYHRGVVDFGKYVEYFYGIGPNININKGEFYDYSRFFIINRSLKKMNDFWYLGVYGQFFKTYGIAARIPDGILNTLNPVGKGGSSVLGVGITAFYDSRDNRFSATKGSFFDVISATYQPFLGSTHAYNYLKIDARHFAHSKSTKIVFANQVVTELNFGSVPFNRLSNIGGQEIGRGYVQGAYRDKSTIQAQTELRFLVYKIVYGATFVSSSKLFSDANALLINDLKWAYGGGVRVMFNKERRLSLRVDAAFTPASSKPRFYLGINEAF